MDFGDDEIPEGWIEMDGAGGHALVGYLHVETRQK